MQRIEVRNFGPLKDIDLEIKDYMVFIGPQASGKSTLAKLIYFFWKVESIYRKEIIPNYGLSKILNADVNRNDSEERLKNRIRELFFEFFPTHRNGIVKFTNDEGASITIDVVLWSDKYFLEDVIFSKSFFLEFDTIESNIKDQPNLGLFLGNQKFNVNDISADQKRALSQGLLQNMFSSLSHNDYEEIFIPAGRSILSLFSNSFAFVENKNLDYFNENFVRLTNIIRKFIGTMEYHNRFGMLARTNSNSMQSNVFKKADELSFSILKGDFQVDNNGDGIMHYYNGSGYIVPLKHTSSGQQESTWLINTIQYLLYNSANKEFDVIIEEPEVHLYPAAQRDITNLITLLANQNEQQTRVIVTTHSPYVLASLNNSVKAYNVSRIEGRALEVERVLDSELWVNSDSLFVGAMRQIEEEGYIIEDIFDKELGLIKHEVLDGVSDDIVMQFDDLLDIEYSE
jgi:energy-coupling factor transporter ATP-binding protein EcfA2